MFWIGLSVIIRNNSVQGAWNMHSADRWLRGCAIDARLGRDFWKRAKVLSFFLGHKDFITFFQAKVWDYRLSSILKNGCASCRKFLCWVYVFSENKMDSTDYNEKIKNKLKKLWLRGFRKWYSSIGVSIFFTKELLFEIIKTSMLNWSSFSIASAKF